MDMANTPTTTMRLDPKLKSDALEVLRPMGLNLSSAVDIFLRAVVRKQGYHSRYLFMKTRTKTSDERNNIESRRDA
jgi:DNA-damage-inducible protein J